MRFKVGVKLHKLQPQTVLAMRIADDIYAKAGVEMVITSVNDSTHMRGSKHYTGEAFDVRTRNLAQGQDVIIYKQIRDALGIYGYDVLHEVDHIHIEWDPKD